MGKETMHDLGLRRSGHTLCGLTGALTLIAGEHVHVPERAYPGRSPSRLARLLQIGNGAAELVRTRSRKATLISGDRLEYLAGDVAYFPGNALRNWWNLLGVRRPFFVVPGMNPSESIAAITNCDADPTPLIRLSTHCGVIILANWNGVPAVLRHASCDQGVTELNRQFEGLRIAGSDPEMQGFAPGILAKVALANGASLLVQERIAGEPHTFDWQSVDAAIDFWLSRTFQSVSADGTGATDQPARLCEAFPLHRDAMIAVGKALVQWRQRVRMPRGIAHGDFWLGNVLFKGDSVCGVIDWEWATRDGLPLVDALYMIFLSYAEDRGRHVALYLRQLWADEWDDEALRDRVAGLGRRFGLDRNDVKFLGLQLWFDLLAQRTARRSAVDDSWMREMISRSMPALNTWLNL